LEFHQCEIQLDGKRCVDFKVVLLPLYSVAGAWMY